MTCTYVHSNSMMSHGTSASMSADFCAHSASMHSANIARILDAIIMASIIICAAIIIRLSTLSLVALVLLAVVLQVRGSNQTPRTRSSV